GQLAVKGQDLPGRQPALVAEKLGEIADLPARVEVSDRPAEEPALARGWCDEPQEQLDRGGLARPVGTEEPEHLASWHGHRESRERHRLAESLRQLDGLDGG